MWRRVGAILISLGAIAFGLWRLVGSQGAASDESVASKVEKVMDVEAAKAPFEGRLGDFQVLSQSAEIPEEARLFTCAGGVPMTQITRDETSLRSSELWSPAFDVQEGAGWSCPGSGIVLVNNQGLEGDTSDGEGFAKIRGYFRSVPVTVLRNAPRDRLELLTVEGHPGLLERPIEGYPYAVANLAVIERYPKGEVPGIVVFVERASSAERAIETAAEVMQ